MTFGHFTSWHADDRGYYTGVEYTPTEVGHFFGAMCPAWYFLQGMMALARAQPLLQKFEKREKVARKSPFHRNV